MPDTNNQNTQNTPPLPPPPDNSEYVKLARPQAHAVFAEQRVEFKDDEVKTVVKTHEPGDDANKTILAKTAKELLDAGRIAYCTKLGKLIEPEKPKKEDDK